MEARTIRVVDCANLDMARPVTGGIPIPEGTVSKDASFGLVDASGAPVDAQTAVLGEWPDGSAKWVLVDFATHPAPSGTNELKLVETESAAHDASLPDLVDRLAIAPHQNALFRIDNHYDAMLTLVLGDGTACLASAEHTKIETAGSQRTTIVLTGNFYRPDRKRVFSFRMRISLYANSPLLKVEPLIIIDADKGIIQDVKQLALTLTLAEGEATLNIGGEPGWQGQTADRVRLFQYDDENYRFEGAEGHGSKAPGWAQLTSDTGTLGVALQEMWQQWPKSIETRANGLAIGLLPAFKQGDYDHMGPWYKHQYFFNEDNYRLRTGQARGWEIWLDLDGRGEALAKHANAPLVATADPTESIATGVWGEIVPAGTPGAAEFDTWAETQYSGYMHSLEAQRDYGAMNWGDWFGEREVNWGNHEYDTSNELLIMYARTGDPRYFYTANAAARHSAQVDTVHSITAELDEWFEQFRPSGYPSRAGLVQEHCIGHVGSFYPVDLIEELFIEHKMGLGREHPYLCLGPFDLGHVFTRGMVQHYFLTGEPYIKEAVEQIADNLSQLVIDREYDFIDHTHAGRILGWPLIALLAAYDLEHNPLYLKAAGILVQDALDDQDPICGGWLRWPMAPDHCTCKTVKHTGMAGFITAIMINAISEYYRVTKDERLLKAIDKAVTFLNNDTWREEWHDWRYTSCPASRAIKQLGVLLSAEVNGATIANNEEHLRILNIAWHAKFERLLQAPEPGPGHGKTFSHNMNGSSETVGLLIQRGLL